MYGKVSTGVLATTGAGIAGLLGWGIAFVVLGGAVLSVLALLPRVAIDPIRREDGTRKLGLTYRGKPFFKR